MSKELLDSIFPPDQTSVVREHIEGMNIVSMVCVPGTEITPSDRKIVCAMSGFRERKPFRSISKIVVKG